MERVGVDVMGPFPRSERGNRFVLTSMDYFTKWPEAYALPDQEAETVVDALVDGMFSRFGVPESIHSDQGRNFESRVFAVMCEKLGIHKTRTTPLHPQSDGLVERFNRTLAEQLAIVTETNQQDWDRHLPFILMAYRSAVQDSTLCTPALLMLGREIRTPGEMAYGRPPDAPAVPPGPEYASRLQASLETAHSFARQHLLKAGIRQKRNYDLKTKGRHFTAGERVWVYSPQRKKGRCPKLDAQWVGPCIVLERIGEVVYRVQMPPRGRKVAVHRDRLAPYRGCASADTVLASPTVMPVLENEAGHGLGSSNTIDVLRETTPVPELQSSHSGGPVADRGSPRSQRVKRPPRRLQDYVCSLEVEELCEEGAV